MASSPSQRMQTWAGGWGGMPLRAWPQARSPALCACIWGDCPSPVQLLTATCLGAPACLPSFRWTNFVNLQDMCGVSVFSGLLRLKQGELGPLAAGLCLLPPPPPPLSPLSIAACCRRIRPLFC